MYISEMRKLEWGHCTSVDKRVEMVNVTARMGVFDMGTWIGLTILILIVAGVAAALGSKYKDYLTDDLPAREIAERDRVALSKATAAALTQLDDFYNHVQDVVEAFGNQHILFGDKYLRLKFKLTPITLPGRYRVLCQYLIDRSDLFSPDPAEIGKECGQFHDFIIKHNEDHLIRFLGYDNSVRKLISTIDEVHLRQLVTLVSGGDAGGSPLGVNMLIADFANVRNDYYKSRELFRDLQARLDKIKLKKPLKSRR